MKPYLVKTPNFIKFLFRNWIWSFSKKEKALYLTFDDGPTPEITEWTLNLLNTYNAKATFFCIGKNVEKHPHIYQKILENSHTIGNHTNNHLNGRKTEILAYIENIKICSKHFKNNLKSKTKNPTLSTIETAKLFRPPYGKLKLKQSKMIRRKGFKIIMWDVLSADFDTSISKEKCLENVIRNTENGSILVFHDSIKASEKLKFVLPKILEYYSEKGFVFKQIA
ncbi:polysaccharide deacetylase family protein [Lutibacter sp.]